MDPAGVKAPDAGSYNSASATGPFALEPPAIKTLPSGRSVAVAFARSFVMVPVGVKERVLGSNSSAVARPPPAIKTFPLLSTVAVWPRRVPAGGLIGENCLL